MDGPTEPERPAARPLEPTAETGEPRLDELARLVAVVDRLRAPDGCPWDREQTVESMGPSLVEEAYEALEAIERAQHEATAEELGDVLLVVTLIARIAEQAGRFSLRDVAGGVADKLVRRHPHVFGEVTVASTGEVRSNWEAIKREERRARGEDASVLAGVPVALPALRRAYQVSKKATTLGFRWHDAAGALAKVEEELRELREAFEGADGGADGGEDEARRARVEAELGDLLVAAGFLGQYLGVDPERAARRALRRFERRFRHMEAALGPAAADADLTAWMTAWRAAKSALREEERGEEEERASSK